MSTFDVSRDRDKGKVYIAPPMQSPQAVPPACQMANEDGIAASQRSSGRCNPLEGNEQKRPVHHSITFAMKAGLMRNESSVNPWNHGFGNDPMHEALAAHYMKFQLNGRESPLPLSFD